MLPLILVGGAVAFIMMKKANTAGNTTTTHTTSGARTAPTASSPGTGSSSILSLLGFSQGPGSVKPNTANSNANQPWYTGPAVTSTALSAGSSVAKGLGNLFSSDDSSDDEVGDDTSLLDDEDLTDSSDDFGVSSYSSTDDDEDAGDYDYNEDEGDWS